MRVMNGRLFKVGSWKTLGAAGLALALTGSSVGIAAADSAGPASTPAHAQGAAVASSVDPVAAASLAILRRPVTADDAVPPAVTASGGNDPADLMNGTNYALARAVTGLGAQGDAWVIPGNGTVCLMADGAFNGQPRAFGGQVCANDASVTRGQLEGVAASARAPGALLVTGIVPDGVATISATLTDGTTETAPVHDNVYMLTVKGPSSPTVTFTTAAGTTNIPAMTIRG